METPATYLLRIDSHNVEHIEHYLQRYLSGLYIYCQEYGTPKNLLTNPSINSPNLVKEGTDLNPHTHLLIQTRTKIQNLRTEVKKHYTGNGQYSLKQCDEPLPPKCVAYLVKDGKYVTNLSAEQVAVAVETNNKIVEDYKQRKKDKKELTSFQQIEKFFLKEHPNPDEYDPQVYMLIVIRYYMSIDMQIRRSSVEAAVNTLLCKYAYNGAGRLAQQWSKFMKE